VSLLQLDPVVADMTTQQMGPVNVVLGIDKNFEARFSVVGGCHSVIRIEEGILDTKRRRIGCLEIRMCVYFMSLYPALTGEDRLGSFDCFKTGRAQVRLGLTNVFMYLWVRSS
jgi:hypothetical protein